jgi:branched-subunit amino acid transport protein
MSTFLAIMATGLGTYFSRGAFILVFANRQIPPNVMLALQYVAPSVLGALVMTMLAGPEGDTAIGTAELAALAVAGAVAWKSRNAIYTLIAGMLVFWLTGAIPLG